MQMEVRVNPNQPEESPLTNQDKSGILASMKKKNTSLPVQAMGLDDIKTHHWCIMGCSAVTGDNLLSGVDWLLDDISARVFTAD